MNSSPYWTLYIPKSNLQWKTTTNNCLLICKENSGKIFTDIYYKTTDSHQYLDFFSCHPKHTKYNIPFTLARRICTIVKTETLREQRLNELTEFLRSNNYPEGIINKGIEKAKKLTIEQLRSTRQKENDNKTALTLVITHNPNNPPVINTVKEHLKLLNNSTVMNPAFAVSLIYFVDYCHTSTCNFFIEIINTYRVTDVGICSLLMSSEFSDVLKNHIVPRYL